MRANSSVMLWTLVSGAILCLTIGSQAATVVHQHPNITIVAEDESMTSVLEALAEKTNIKISVPPGLSLKVSAEVNDQPIEQAMEQLLKSVSYTIVWDEEGNMPSAIVIFGESGDSLSIDSPGQFSQPVRNGRSAHDYQLRQDPKGSDESSFHTSEQEAKVSDKNGRVGISRMNEAHELRRSDRQARTEDVNREKLQEQQAEHETTMEDHMQSLGIAPR